MENKYNIDKAELMLLFVGVIHSSNDSGQDKIHTMMTRFISFIEERIGREILPNEKIDLYKGCLTFVQSKPCTNERMEVMDYLFSLEFLE
jgi:hypothetical protein